MAVVTEADTVVRDAFALAPLLSENAAAAEELHTMPGTVVSVCEKAGVFRLLLPRSLGGLGCDPLTTIRIIEELSRADGSGGWTAMIGNTSSFVSWLDPGVAREILSTSGGAAFAGLLSPSGTAVPDGDGGFVVSGRWAFNSGAPHASWFCNGVIVMDGDQPRIVPPGRPDWRFAFFPAADAEIIETWRAAGLKGTGSHDIAVNGIHVPQERTCSPLFEPARQDAPFYRISFWNLLMVLMAGFPLGVARRALDEFNETAQRKSRSMQGARLADDEAIQIEYGRAEASVQAARALVFDAFGRAWETLQSGSENSLEERTRMTMSVLHAVHVCTTAVDMAFHRAGGGALYESSPLQRCFRDIHAGGQHIAFSLESWKRVGKSVLGVDQPTFMI